MRSQSLLPLAFASSTFASVFDLPIWVRNTYSVVQLSVGTPPVPHFLLFDTGSSTTWIVNTDCDDTDCPNTSGYARTGYNAAASSTSEQMNTSASMDFLGGVTVGSGVRDTFALPAPAACNASSVSWTQSFLGANQSTWASLTADGFLGLAFSSIADANTTTVVETMMQDGLLDNTRFGLYLGTNTNDTGNAAGDGVLTLGGSRESVYTVEGKLDDLNWATLQPSDEYAQLWRTNVQYAVGTHPNKTANGTTTAVKQNIAVGGAWSVFDSGAGRISVPDTLVDDIYASIGMNWTAILHGDVIPLCADFTDDWYLDMFVGSAIYPTKLHITGSMLKTPGFATGEDKYCWPPFDTSDSSGLFLMGAQFLQNFYTVFDFGGAKPADYNARIGFGTLKDEYKPVV